MLKTKIYLSVLLTAALVILFGWAKTSLLDENLPFNFLKLPDKFWINKIDAQGPYHMVVLGDSRIYFGISPYDIEQVLPGRHVLNFGFARGGLNQTIFTAAEKKLGQNPAGKIILLGVTPASLTAGTTNNALFNQYRKMSANTRFIKKYIGDVSAFFSPIKASELYSLLKSAAKKSQTKTFSQIPHGNGWVEAWQIPPDPNAANTFYRNFFKQSTVSPQLIDGLYRQTRRWVAQGIIVAGFRPPTAESLKKIENDMSGFDEEHFAGQFKQAGGIWIDVNDADFTAYDGSHLESNSAKKLSRYLATTIKQHLAGTKSGSPVNMPGSR